MFEGFGGNGQLQKGISVYGSTKRALRYFTAAAAMNFTHLLSLDQSVPASLRLTCSCVHQNQREGL